jgi:hypothetical protein
MLSAAGVSIEPGQVSEVPRESTSTTDPKNTITIPSETTVDDNKSQQASTCFFRAQKMPEWFCNPPKNHMLIFTPGYRLSQLPEAQIKALERAQKTAVMQYCGAKDDESSYGRAIIESQKWLIWENYDGSDMLLISLAEVGKISCPHKFHTDPAAHNEDDYVIMK